MTIRAILTACTLTVLAAVGGGTVSAHAAAEHVFLPEEYDAVEHFDAGDGPCVDWAGSFHEVRDGGYRLVVPRGGQLPPETHLNGAIVGLVELVPDDPTLPTYTGTYREKVVGVLTGGSMEDDSLRVAQYHLSTRLHGTDGSSLVLRLSGKLTVNARGRLVVSRDAFSCA